jgi:hypothetical protein
MAMAATDDGYLLHTVRSGRRYQIPYRMHSVFSFGLGQCSVRSKQSKLKCRLLLQDLHEHMARFSGTIQ